MTEILAQFGAASAFAGILATLLWRVIQQSRDERAETFKAIREDQARNVDALNGLKDVMIEMKTILHSQNVRRDGER